MNFLCNPEGHIRRFWLIAKNNERIANSEIVDNVYMPWSLIDIITSHAIHAGNTRTRARPIADARSLVRSLAHCNLVVAREV